MKIFFCMQEAVSYASVSGSKDSITFYDYYLFVFFVPVFVHCFPVGNKGGFSIIFSIFKLDQNFCFHIFVLEKYCFCELLTHFFMFLDK